MGKNYTREELINLCERAVVNFKDWNDRDSHIAQVNIQSAYEGLTGGVNYAITEYNFGCVWIKFEKPTDEQKRNFKYLDIDDREDYINWQLEEFADDPDLEMFEGYGINWNEEWRTAYIPTLERLEEREGEDWY